jgi:putative hemolysin
LIASFLAWWGNPVTAALGALFWLIVLILALVGAAGVIRSGGFQVMGLLSHRSHLLPGFPRKGHAYSTLLLFLLGVLGALSVAYVFALVRLGEVTGLGLPSQLLLALFGWVLGSAVAAVVTHGARAERVAHGVLVGLRPFSWWLARLVPSAPEEEEDEEEEDEEEERLAEHEVRAFIGAGEAAGILEREDAELIASIVEMGDTVAREIMTPRTDVLALPMSADFDTMQQRFTESMFTRLPVYRETLDRIEGMIHVKDVLKALQAGSRPSAGQLLRPVLVVPETKPLRELLREFQAARQQLAVVVDEYGGTSGIVTLEDVLEEIVGEIQDEHQAEVPDVEPEGPDTYLLAGVAHAEVLEDLFGVEIGDVDFDSVAGLLLDRLGHLPRPGEKATFRDLELEAVEVDRRRLRRVRVRRLSDKKGET